jgi:hypothetical protein
MLDKQLHPESHKDRVKQSYGVHKAVGAEQRSEERWAEIGIEGRGGTNATLQ